MNTIRENLFVGGIGFPGDIDFTVNNTMYFKEGLVNFPVRKCSCIYKRIIEVWLLKQLI